MDALIGPGVDVVKCAIPPIMRQIGYCIHYKKNVEKLRTRVEELNNTRTELQKRVDEAENNLESIKKSVLDWFGSVDKETTQDETMLRLLNDEATFEMINQQCCKGLCCCRARWNIGRDAQKKMVIIDELLSRGRGFGNNVSDPSPPVGMQFIPTNEDFEDFQSRKSLKNQIIAALKDDKTYLVGVYGMGGVGKTMLVNQVYKLAMEKKLFDTVAMTTVSEKVDLKDIQNEIAKQLGLERLQATENIYTRAAMLRERLMKQNKKFLVILDDLWTTELSLSDVGIPYGEAYCKVVITTKSLDVCHSLRSHKNIEVKVLLEEESWHLFKKNVGEDAAMSSPDLETVARNIAKECGNLPIALVTIARSLINKDKHVWVDTANQLKNSDFSSLGEINSKVFKSIKLSYDHLGNETIKKCFLLCCLFPEDYRISIDELMMHVMGDYEILKNMGTLKQVRDRLHTVLDKLMASCLLLGHKLDDGGIFKVWMHDIVRYVASSIASEEGSGFFAESGVRLKYWPESWRLLSRSNMSKCLRVSLMRNEISELPDQLELPHLLCLSLEGNKALKKIPDSFFQKVEALATLNLRNTGISSLPPSLSCLMHLRTLRLDYCVFDQSIDITLIGKLKKLEILSLQHCRLSMLPKEIGGLLNLKLLNLSNNPGLHTMPPNVISSLSHLEELHMMKSFCKWEVEGTGNASDASNASLDEVTSLIALNALHLDVHYKEIMFFISIDHASKKRTIRYDESEHFSCFLTAPSPFCRSIKVLLERVDSLILRSCTGLRSVGQLLMGAGLNNLSSLFVIKCHEMEYLINAVEKRIQKTTFLALEKLQLQSLDKLKEIFHGPMSAGFLDKLKFLKVEKCKDLVSIFPSNVSVMLKNLKVLRVEKCGKLKEVIYLKEDIVRKEGLGSVTFPRLRGMCLRELSELKIIWKGVIPLESLQYLKVMEVKACNGLRYLFSPAIAQSLWKLEKLIISQCRGLVTVMKSEEMEELDQVLVLHPSSTTTIGTAAATTTRPPQILPNLKNLIIEDCDSLKHLYPPSMRLLVHCCLSKLRLLVVANCKSLEEIINARSAEEDDAVAVVGRQLRKLHLENLPNLVTSRKGVIPINGRLEYLQELTVRNCNHMKHLLHGDLPQLKKLVVSDCNSLDEIVINGSLEYLQELTVTNCNHMKHLLHGDLPQLKKLVVSDCNSLDEIVINGSLEYIQELTVTNCNHMKHLLHGGLPQLKKLDVCGCNSLEEIINNELDERHEQKLQHDQKHVLLPKLSNMQLQKLPNLMTIAKGFIPLGSLKNLSHLSVARCNRMKHILPMKLLIHGGLSNLRSLSIKWCKNLEAVFNDVHDDPVLLVHDPDVKMKVVLPRLRELFTYKVPKLSSFLKLESSVLVWPPLKVLKKRRFRLYGHEDIVKRLGYPYRNYINPKPRIWRESRVKLKNISWAMASLCHNPSSPMLRFFYPSHYGKFEVMDILNLPDAKEEKEDADNYMKAALHQSWAHLYRYRSDDDDDDDDDDDGGGDGGGDHGGDADGSDGGGGDGDDVDDDDDDDDDDEDDGDDDDSDDDSDSDDYCDDEQMTEEEEEEE